MLYTADVRDWLKGLIGADHFYIGKLDNKPDKAVGVYEFNRGGYPVRGIGQDTTYDIISVSTLIHWTNNAKDTEEAARALFEALRTARGVVINEHTIYIIELITPAPICLATDEKGVYEWVIQFELFYERK
ncbi:MAG: minor capsid protein [Eubacteriales bacterium]|nr:minor capsid protein [Eubacteriales bacterium]